MAPPAHPVGKSIPRRFLRRIAAGSFVFREGDGGSEMFIIHDGEVEIIVEETRGARRLARLEKGDFFGEMSLLEDMPRNASARALTDVELVRVDRATFDKMLRDNPEIAVRIMRKLSLRLREADRLVRRGVAAAAESPPATTVVPRHRLVHRDTRRTYVIDSREVIVGRRDPVTGLVPGVDLTAIDAERSSSRRHAKIVYREGRLHLVEDIGTTNGTFVNGKRLEAGVPVQISVGDVLRFGLVELELRNG